jgi:hypothetical protein
MTSFVLVVLTLAAVSFFVAVRAKRRDDLNEFRGPGPIDAEIKQELVRREQETEA